MPKLEDNVRIYIGANDRPCELQNAVNVVAGTIIAVEASSANTLGYLFAQPAGNVPLNAVISAPWARLKVSDVAFFRNYPRFTLHQNIDSYIDCVSAWVGDKHFVPVIQTVVAQPFTPCKDMFITYSFKEKSSLDPTMDGASCERCKEFIPYAEKGVVCYLCRQDPYRYR